MIAASPSLPQSSKMGIISPSPCEWKLHSPCLASDKRPRIAPNVTSEASYFLKLKDDSGNVEESPKFSLSREYDTPSSSEISHSESAGQRPDHQTVSRAAKGTKTMSYHLALRPPLWRIFNPQCPSHLRYVLEPVRKLLHYLASQV